MAAGGRHYAQRAKAIADAMHARAARLQCRITTSGVAPGAMQLADWLGDRGESVVTLLHAWNQQCRDEGLPTCGLAVIDFAVDGWDKLHPHSGRLERFVTPRPLKPATD